MTLIIPLSEIKKQDLSRVGGKAVALANMAQHSLNVPDALGVTTDAYNAYVIATGLRERILLELNRKQKKQNLRDWKVWRSNMNYAVNWDALQFYYQIRKLDPRFPRVYVKIGELEKEVQPKLVPVMASQAPVIKPTRNAPVSFRLVAIGIAALLVIILCIWGGINIWNNLVSATSEPIQTFQPVATNTSQPAKTDTPSPTKTPIPPTTTLGIGSTMIGNDGMILPYVPAGESTMGSVTGSDDEKPVHTVNLDAFWIDKTSPGARP